MPNLRWERASAGMLFALLVGCSDAAVTTHIGTSRAPLVGGRPDTTTHGVIGMIIDNNSGCTGSLIAPNLVLTARHCVAPINNPDGVVQCGVTNFGNPFAPSAFVVTTDNNMRDGVPMNAQFGVDRVVTTPAAGVCGNDVSLLVLSANVPTTAAMTIVPRIDDAPAANDEFSAVGYGITDPNDQTGATFGQRLRVDGLSVLCVGTSCGMLGGSRTEWGAYTPVCSGDSGGPALDSAGRVMGVASRGDANCEAALYGNVSSWKDLIVSTAIDAATAGGYPPPSWTGTTSMDGGAPDADVPDSGTDPPDSGMPEEDSGVTDPPDAGGGVVGEPCTGSCAGGLVCYEPNENNDDGICVPECSGTNDRSCPGGYVCNGRLAVCVPKVPDTLDDTKDSKNDPGDSGGCGCHTAARPDGHAAWVLAFLPLALALRRGRRGRVVG